MNRFPHPRRVRKKRLGIILGSITLTLLLLTGGGFAWLWCWSWKAAPEFHDSWSEEERAALLELDREIRQALAEAISSVDAFPDLLGIFQGQSHLEAFLDALHTVYVGRGLSADLNRRLHRIAHNGQGADDRMISYGPQQQHQTTLTIFAAQTGQLQALEALVAHGADPNTIIYTENAQEGETPLTPVINGHFLNGASIPWKERQKTADFLLQLGADINGSKRIIGIACDMPIMLEARSDSRPWLWALDHGKTMSIENLCNIVACRGATPVLERVLREKRIDLNDAGGKRTVLQALLQSVSYVFDEETWQELQERQIEQRLDLLLAAGAAPNLVPRDGEARHPDESNEEYEIRCNQFTGDDRYPLDIVTGAQEQATLPAHRELCRRLIEKLRAAGAVSRYAQ